MKKYDIFLFDADGTLYDYDMAEANALKTMFVNCGFDYSENIRTKYREINSQVWESYEKGEISKDDLQILRFSRLFKNFGISYDAENFNKKYLIELGKGTFLIDGALEICKEITLCNKKIYIITNGILATQETRIKHSLIKEYISDFFVSEVVGFQKPDTKYFEYVVSNIPQAEKAKMLIIGDSLSADIQGGCNAGIDSCWFNENSKDNHTNAKPTYEIKKLNEIWKFI